MTKAMSIGPFAKLFSPTAPAAAGPAAASPIATAVMATRGVATAGRGAGLSAGELKNAFKSALREVQSEGGGAEGKINVVVTPSDVYLDKERVGRFAWKATQKRNNDSMRFAPGTA